MKKILIFFVIIFFAVFLLWEKEEKNELLFPTNKSYDEKKEQTKKEVKVDDSTISFSGPSYSINKSKKRAKNKISLIKGNLQVQKIIENYFSNRQRTSFNQDLLISQNLRAVKKSNYRDLMGEQVSEKAGFIIYKVSELGVKESFSIQSKSLPVVYDTVKNTFAILTGKIVLNIKKGINLKSLSKRMKLKNFFFEDRMIFGNYEDLNSVLNLINKNDNVQSFEVEIIDSIPEPN